MREFTTGGNGDEAGFGGVFLMQMAACGADVLPAIVLKLFDDVAVFHFEGGQK